MRESFNAKFEIINDSFNEKLKVVVANVIETTGDQIKDASKQVVTHTNALLSKYDDGIQRQFSKFGKMVAFAPPSVDNLEGLTPFAEKDSTSAASGCEHETVVGPSTGDGAGYVGTSAVVIDGIDLCPDKRGGTDDLTTYCPLAPEAGACDLGADDTSLLYVGDKVTLFGLKTEVLNGASGTICSFDETSGRYAVKLSATGENKLIKETNLGMYRFDPHSPELCQRCSVFINLNALPACDCEPTFWSCT